jgi:hypothetical protein
MVLGSAMAEIEAHHVDACANHFFQQSRIAGSRAKGGNNFGSATDHEKGLL